MRKLKICSPQLGFNPNSDLGGEVHDHFVLHSLAKRGHTIFVYLPKDRPYGKHHNIIVQRAPFKHIPAFLFNFLIIPYLFSTYKKEKFDILRVHNPYFVGLGALIFKFFHPQVPITTTHHLVENNMLFDLINKMTAAKYDAIITVSLYVKNWLVKRYGLVKNKIHVIYNGTDMFLKPQPKDASLLKKYRLEGKVILMFMGLLIERKNPLFLLKLFQNLKIKYQNVGLLICGEGPLKKTMLSFVKEKKLTDVIFVGKVFGDAKLKHFNLCDIFVIPSKDEGFGIVIGEAMSCTKPVVATDAWSAREAIVPGINGFLAKENDLNDWIGKVGQLITSEKLRKSLGINALRKAEREFNWQKLVSRREEIFQKLVS